MIKTIYLDMDGVLVDFDTRYYLRFQSYPHNQTKDSWDENWIKFIEEKHFETMDWHPHGEYLLNHVERVVEEVLDNHNHGIGIEILSSSGGPVMFDEIANQKKKWLMSRDIPYTTHIVPGKKFKKDFANPHTILIDDIKQTIDRFNAAGGYGIYHEGDFKPTIKELESIIYNKLGQNKND